MCVCRPVCVCVCVTVVIIFVDLVFFINYYIHKHTCTHRIKHT